MILGPSACSTRSASAAPHWLLNMPGRRLVMKIPFPLASLS
jgi:hypothetical protein